MNYEFTKLIVCLGAVLALAPAHAGESLDGKDYTNFGSDLRVPIFPKNGELKFYKNKNDSLPFHTERSKRIQLVATDWKKCLYSKTGDGWVRCSVGATTGWIKRADFLSGGEYQPFTQWPIRYWLNVAGSGMGGEGTDLLIKAAKRSPYLFMPAEYDNIFFIVSFDDHGNAISLKTGKKTGDRVFLVGKAVYLAPDNAKVRDSARWLFLNFFDPELKALCPAEVRDSCYSAVNLSDFWPGVRALYTQPAQQFYWKEEPQYNEKNRSFGAQEVAFARHTDPVRPLMYTVPDDVHMAIDQNGLTDAQIKKNRANQFCIMDCEKKPAAFK